MTQRHLPRELAVTDPCGGILEHACEVDYLLGLGLAQVPELHYPALGKTEDVDGGHHGTLGPKPKAGMDGHMLTLLDRKPDLKAMGGILPSAILHGCLQGLCPGGEPWVVMDKTLAYIAAKGLMDLLARGEPQEVQGLVLIAHALVPDCHKAAVDDIGQEEEPIVDHKDHGLACLKKGVEAMGEGKGGPCNQAHEGA